MNQADPDRSESVSPRGHERCGITVVETPIGRVVVEDDGRAIRRVHLVAKAQHLRAEPSASAIARAAKGAIADYFSGKSALQGSIRLDYGDVTPFQRAVMNTLRQVPVGSVVSYGELATRAGYPGAARAVGSVMRTNPVPLFVPCHRVVASGGLGGFGGGLVMKRKLLDLERAIASNRTIRNG